MAQAGIVIACPHCSQPFKLELEVCESFPSAAALELATIASAFQGHVEPRALTPRYKAAVALVAGVMLLTVLLYLVLVAGATGGLAWYTVHESRLVSGRHDGGFLFWVFYVTPIIVLLLVVVFLLKPLLARRAPRPASLALNPEVEPLLYGFISKVCETVRAPMPGRIYLDCELNASAGFQKNASRGGQPELVLTLGVPLMAGLTAQQFAGVVAHEFGHFTQKRTLRLVYLVWRIRAWFARLAYEPDSWDLDLADWMDPDRNPWGTVLVGIARSGVTLARGLIKGLFHLGAAASSFLSRQMEFDADRYEYTVAGSSAFEATLRQIRFLGRARNRAYELLNAWYQDGKTLPANFPAFVLEQEARLDAYVRSRLAAAMAKERTRFFDSHPSDCERLRLGREAAAPGLVQLPGLAKDLLGNFSALAAQVTIRHYSEDLRWPAA